MYCFYSHIKNLILVLFDDVEGVFLSQLSLLSRFLPQSAVLTIKKHLKRTEFSE